MKKLKEIFGKKAIADEGDLFALVKTDYPVVKVIKEKGYVEVDPKNISKVKTQGEPFAVRIKVKKDLFFTFDIIDDVVNIIARFKGVHWCKMDYKIFVKKGCSLVLTSGNYAAVLLNFENPMNTLFKIN